MIRTVTGDIAPETLGPTLVHEHLRPGSGLFGFAALAPLGAATAFAVYQLVTRLLAREHVAVVAASGLCLLRYEASNLRGKTKSRCVVPPLSIWRS